MRKIPFAKVVEPKEDKATHADLAVAIDSMLMSLDSLIDAISEDAVKEQQIVGIPAFRLLKVKE